MANLNSLMLGGWEADDAMDAASEFDLWIESLGNEEFVPSLIPYGTLQDEPYQHNPVLEPEVHSEPSRFESDAPDELPF